MKICMWGFFCSSLEGIPLRVGVYQLWLSKCQYFIWNHFNLKTFVNMNGFSFCRNLSDDNESVPSFSYSVFYFWAIMEDGDRILVDIKYFRHSRSYRFRVRTLSIFPHFHNMGGNSPNQRDVFFHSHAIWQCPKYGQFDVDFFVHQIVLNFT